MWSRSKSLRVSSAFSLFVAMLLTASSPGVADASACCIGSTSSQAGRLGRCEALAVGVGLSTEGVVGSWTSRGDFSLVRNHRDITHRLIGLFALRPTRKLQFGLSIPLVLQARSIDALTEVGGGPGDLNMWVRFEPFEDTLKILPVPSFSLLITAPTGIPLDKAKGSLGTGATGTGHWAFGGAVAFEQTIVRGGLEFGAEARASTPRRVDGHRRSPGVAWQGYGSGSYFLRPDVTLSWSGGVRGLTPGWIEGRSAGTNSIEPFIGFTGAFKVGGTDRLTIGLRSSLPIPKLGLSDQATVSISMTYTHIKQELPRIKRKAET